MEIQIENKLVALVDFGMDLQELKEQYKRAKLTKDTVSIANIYSCARFRVDRLKCYPLTNTELSAVYDYVYSYLDLDLGDESEKAEEFELHPIFSAIVKTIGGSV